ncbi:Putative zinc metalloprotease Rip3 [Aquisphaera giovannonii]|uniref:Zinc metalloprotease n=1 Tax=Aquisphaera giovannonii TaxID=406548 RepID=A0A5B9W228_9BACT|nr:site-2 protease family protein [Aquisphaera giovannonii]QEH34055.1 Putative zinc metalloprotease Rip3 [Aquisphaera giovannonii]
MSWSLKIGRVAGIPIFVHWTFLILLGWIMLGQWGQSRDATVALAGGLFIITLFACVVLHELGHALMAKRFGVETSAITLLPIGGVASLQRIPEHPVQELLIAAAGPMVNVVIAAVLYLALGVRFPGTVDDAVHLEQGDFWARILKVNVFLVGFNLIPAFPMDGGRMLRALLAMRLPYARATRLAASIGQALAIGFAFLGYSSNPMLMLIALFVWIGAEAEARQVEDRTALRGLRVRDAMLTEFHALKPTDTLGHAADLLLAGTQHDFPVSSPGETRFRSILTRADLMAGLAASGREGTVAGHARTELPAVEVASDLAEAVASLQEGQLSCLQVTDRDRTVGLLSLENVGECLLVRSALRGSDSAPPGPGRRLIAAEA